MSAKKILFVCLGNICRSPAAEAIMQRKSVEAGISVVCDSAGTSGYHSGEPADARMCQHAERRGHKIAGRSRKLIEEDYEKFDYIVAMDMANYSEIMARIPTNEKESKILKMTDYCQHIKVSGVPDPYYGGDAGFEKVLDILEDACAGLIEKIQRGDL